MASIIDNVQILIIYTHFLHYYKWVNNYKLIEDCNKEYTNVQTCINYLTTRKFNTLAEWQIKFINDTYLQTAC